MKSAGPPRSGDFERVREELRRQGYLSHGIERFLLSDALGGGAARAAFVLLAAKVGLLVGALLALGNALALAIANGALGRSPVDLPVLVLHLAPPLVVAATCGFAALAAGFLLALGRLSPRRLAGLVLGFALVVGLGIVVAALPAVRPLTGGLATWQRALAAVGLAAASAAIAFLVADGLLSLGIRWTREVPRTRILTARGLALAFAAAAATLVAVAVVAPERPLHRAPPALPTAPGEAVVLVGIDGVRGEELDYLLARGLLPNVSAALARGGAVLRYRRPAGPPAELWTTVATGVPGSRHGVTSLDSFLPIGARTPLVETGPWRLYFARFEVPVGLASYRPMLATERRSHAVWELAARGGKEAAAIGWWATYPPEATSGLVVAHGAFQLLARGASPAVAPADREAEVAALAGTADLGPFAAPLVAALGGEAARSVGERAFLSDRFAWAVAEREAARRPRLLALYLPGLDIAADGWPASEVAFADLVKEQLTLADHSAAALPEAGLVVWVIDPGRRGGDEGRLLVLRAGCAAPPPDAPLVAVAPSIFRALGLPQSRELAPPFPFCPWPDPPAVVDGYGDRAASLGPVASGDDYLESLRALGYL